MFAKLTTKTGNWIPDANTYFNTLIGVITGTITSNTQLDQNTFVTSASYIINTIPSGWSLNDPQANLVGTVPLLPGRPPVVIKADWTDSPLYAKYLWIAPRNFGNTTYNIVAVPAEGWANTTKTISNSAAQPAAVVANNNLFGRSDMDFVGPMNNFHTGNGIVTIISSSQAHLFVATYKDFSATQFNSYYWVSEYSRDDPWNTVNNGYPSWFQECCSNNTGTFNISLGAGQLDTSGFSVTQGRLARINYTANNTDIPWVGLFNTNNLGNANYGLTTRYIPWAQNGSQAPSSFFPPGGMIGFGGLVNAGKGYNFTGNQNYGRDINKNPARILAELRVTGVHNGANVNSNTIFGGGSINTVAPFIYVTNQGWASLDEVTISGETYMNLNLGTSLVGSVDSTAILIREA